jgi:di/tricarboxylate transporter
MGWEAIFCLVVFGLIIAGLVRNISVDALLLGGVVLVTLVGIISAEEALSGFSNQAVLTVGALYVIAAALRETGALAELGRRVFGQVRTEKRFLTRMSGLLPVMSAFLNNTPIVAMFIPIVSDWCRRHRVAASRLLIPLSYLCIFGGTCTLIGTSTNLVVNGLMEETASTSPSLEQTLKPMGFFELGKVGLPYAVIGVLYMFFVGRHLLPSRKDPMDELTSAAREYLVNLLVQPDCRLVGQTIEQAGLRHLPGLFLAEITRDEQAISPVSPDYKLRASDILTFTGVVRYVTLIFVPVTMQLLSRCIAAVSVWLGRWVTWCCGREIRYCLERGRILCVRTGTIPIFFWSEVSRIPVHFGMTKPCCH